MGKKIVAEGQESSLAGFSKAVAESGQRREQERQELNRKLGEPAVFVADPDDPRFGVGYWKADNGGVFSYRRYANGYDQNSRCEYSNEFIDILLKVRA